MKSKFHFSLAIGLIALASAQASADDIRNWVAPMAGAATAGSLTALNFASAKIADRLENRADAIRISALNAKKKGSLLEEKAKLEKELADADHWYKHSYADLQNQIADSHKIMKIAPGQLKLTESGLPLSVDMAFQGTEQMKKKVDLLKKQINLLEKQIAAIPAHGETTQALYKSAALGEKEAYKLIDRSKKFWTVGKMGGAAFVPATLLAVVASASVTNKIKKAESVSAANQSPPQTPTAPASENSRAE